MHLSYQGTAFVTLKKRAHFLKIQASDKKFITPRLILCALPLMEMGIVPVAQTFYGGFTVTRSVGQAVGRNTVKRRLRVLLPPALVRHGNPAAAYIVIARKAAHNCLFNDLENDLNRGVRYLCSKYSF